MKFKVDWKQAWYLLAISIPVAVIDQVTKVWSIKLKGAGSVEIFNTWFHLVYAENRGALWGIGNQLTEFNRKLIFIGFSSLVTLFILGLLFVKSETKLMSVVYALVLGGSIGNHYDRLFRGYVIDFIDWHLGPGPDAYHWPTFNIADAAIVVAVGLLFIEVMILNKDKYTDKKEENSK